MDKKKGLKKIKSLEELREEHLQKIAGYKGPKYTLKPYWEKEIKKIEEEIEKEKKKLKKAKNH